MKRKGESKKIKTHLCHNQNLTKRINKCGINVCSKRSRNTKKRNKWWWFRRNSRCLKEKNILNKKAKDVDKKVVQNSKKTQKMDKLYNRSRTKDIKPNRKNLFNSTKAIDYKEYENILFGKCIEQDFYVEPKVESKELDCDEIIRNFCESDCGYNIHDVLNVDEVLGKYRNEKDGCVFQNRNYSQLIAEEFFNKENLEDCEKFEKEIHHSYGIIDNGSLKGKHEIQNDLMRTNEVMISGSSNLSKNVTNNNLQAEIERIKNAESSWTLTETFKRFKSFVKKQFSILKMKNIVMIVDVLLLYTPL